MRTIFKTFCLLVCVVSLALHEDEVRAADKYPSKAIRLIVPYAPGGSTDKTARLTAEYLGNSLKQSIVVENKPGANNMVAANDLIASAADGYTVMLASNGLLTMAPALFSKISFNPAKDFTLIGLVNTSPMVIATSGRGKYHDMGSVLAKAKATPGSVTYAVSGGLVPELIGARLQKMGDLKMLEVRYRGTGPYIADLITGRVDLGIMGVSLAAPLSDAGKLTLLAVTSKERTPALPAVPTLVESGVRDFDTVVWNALIGPKGLPAPVVATLSRALDEIYHDPKFRKQLQLNGEKPLRASPEELQHRVADETAVWQGVVKEAGIPPMD